MGPGGMRELWNFTRGSQYATAEPDEVAIEGTNIDEQALLVYSHFPCSFPFVFVDSSCRLYGRPARAAIQSLLVI